MNVGAAAVRARVAALAIAPALAVGCGDSYFAVLDSYPIPVSRAPMGAPVGIVAGDGALWALAASPAGGDPTFPMVIDTGTPLTLLAGPATSNLKTARADFDVLDPSSTDQNPIVRGSFRAVSLLRVPLMPIGDGSVAPGGIMGGDILRRYSIDLRFGATCGTSVCSSMTFWNHLGPDLGFLEDSGYAVLRFSLYGGGEITAEGDPDFLGQRGPLTESPTRIVLRGCVAPKAFMPDLSTMADKCCTATDAQNQASGVDLALTLYTGVGPLVLSQSAWDRVTAELVKQFGAAGKPMEISGSVLRVATWPMPIPAKWSTIPRFALVDLEAGSAADPGPCVELQRARRIERVSAQIVSDEMMGISSTACTQPCDNDPRETNKAQNSAAYLEVSGQVPIPVAVIGDAEPFLQGLRFDVRPEGPEVDGLIGAGALGRARVEIDYPSAPPRAVFSCEPDVPRTECFAAARCPRLPDASYRHLCFGLPSHGLAPSCAPSGC